MVFPDGSVKEGIFENNIFIGDPLKNPSIIQGVCGSTDLSSNCSTLGKTFSRGSKSVTRQRTPGRVSEISKPST